MKIEEKAFLEETIKEVEHKLENKEALSTFKKQQIVWLGHDARGVTYQVTAGHGHSQSLHIFVKG